VEAVQVVAVHEDLRKKVQTAEMSWKYELYKVKVAKGLLKHRCSHLRVDLRPSSLTELIVRAESGSPGPAPGDAAIGL